VALARAALAEAARKQETVCNDEQWRLIALQAMGSKAKDDLKELAHSMTCEPLRPLVTAALEKASTNAPDQVRAAQRQLARLGCYSDAVDGAFSDSTKKAITLYQSARGKPDSDGVQITDDFVAELKDQSGHVCESKPVVAHHEGEDVAKGPKKAVAGEDKRPAGEEAAASHPRVRQEAPVRQEASAGGHAATIGVGF